MKISAFINNLGISFGIDKKPSEHLIPLPDVSQKSPKQHYVYGHFDEHGIPFYIGKGKGRRAWDNNRHPLWHRYVQKHLNGKFSVVILIDNLSSDRAEEEESNWITQETDTLVNWVNYNRKTDYSAIDKFHKLRDENRALVESAHEIEQSNRDEALKAYYQALENIAAYAYVQPDCGLVGKLINEEREENGIRGDMSILNKLINCLVKMNRKDEAAEIAKQYFAKYRADEALSSALRIKNKIGIAK